MIYDNILQVVGNTPTVRLNRIGKETGVELYREVRVPEPGRLGEGSHRRAHGRRAGEAAASRSGDTLIEATSGNTGIGMRMTAAVKGYRVIITMPEKMSREKQVVLEALGAEIIRTPTEAPHDSPESHIGVAARLNREIPNSVILDQYGNPDNPRCPRYGTGAEIWRTSATHSTCAC